MKGSILAILGIILTAIGIISPIIYTEIKNQSEIEVKRENSITIITKPSGIDSLEIYYKKQKISEIKKRTYRITNKSNISVVKSDFINPINIALSKDAKIISFDVEERHPKNLSSEFIVDSSQHSISVDFELLNPGDYILIGILYTGNISDTQIAARIKGVKDIVYREIAEKINVFPPLIVLSVIFISTLFFGLFYREKKDSYTRLKMLEVANLRNLNQEELIEKFQQILDYLPKDEIILIVDKIKSIYSNDKLEEKDKITKSIELMTVKLKEVILLNKRAEIIVNILRLIGMIYLLIWLITTGNNVYAQLIG